MIKEEEAIAMIRKKISRLSKQQDRRRRRARPSGGLDANDIERIQNDLRGKLSAFLELEAPDGPSAPKAPKLEEEVELPEAYRQIVERFNAKASRYYERDEAEAEPDQLDAEAEDPGQLRLTEAREGPGKEASTARAGEERKLSRRQQKELLKKKLAQLKVMVERPDLVESWDVTAPDPLLLVHLKSYKNTVEVPRHWSQKKKFLQTKRGAFKRAFRLPAFIEARNKLSS